MIHRALIRAWLIACVSAPITTNAQQGNPYEADPAAVRVGGVLYASRCADCHGPDAKGTRGPDLTALWAAGADDERVFQSIRTGVADTIMPPSPAPDDEIWAIVAYLRTVSTVAPFEIEGADIGHGRELFAELCANCHRVGASGGILGQDLTRIAQVRSREALTRAIREPSASAAAGYRTVKLVTKSGERIVGIAKREDAFSIQVVDTDERLQGYRKTDLQELVHDDESLMPPFPPEQLGRRDLDDLLAFLGTLRGDGPSHAAGEVSGAVADSIGRTMTGANAIGGPAAATLGDVPRVAGVTSADLLDGLADPSRWLTFSGDYSGRRHSPLEQITPANVHRLVPAWTFQTGTLARGRGFETTPLVHDGVLYVTGPNNYAWALDARTGRAFWEYRRELPDDLTYGASAPVNRGFGILGDRLFMVTLDAHLLALDRRTGGVVWDSELADYRLGYAATLAPLVVGDKVIVGISGGEYATRGFLDAYDPATGERLWRLHTIPAPGEPGSETWPNADVMVRGGGATWMTGSYDPELDLLYWATGNPNPDYYGADRKGDNLYTNSLLAVEPDTGALRWHYQFTPHDTHDWDSNHVPVLADLRIGRTVRRTVMVANRNGFFYVLDRATGKLLLGEPFTATTWAREIGRDGRPVVLNEDGSRGCLPDQWGGTNFMPPSFDPKLALFFVSARETCATFVAQAPALVAGEQSTGGVVWADTEVAYGALRAIDARTGERRWEFRYPTPTMAGVMSTASGLVFAGDNEGNFMAFASATGEHLWRYPTGAPIWGAAAMTFMLDGRQHVLIPSGGTLLAFALATRARAR
jgi:alcohol dehydrogenase (cytochrome c)